MSAEEIAVLKEIAAQLRELNESREQERVRELCEGLEFNGAAI